jgi:hypothetical protein
MVTYYYYHHHHLQFYDTTDFYNGVGDYKYEDIFTTFPSRRRHFDTLFLINVFKGKFGYSSVLDTVSPHICIMSVRNYFTAHRNCKDSPAAGSVSSANAILS